jgi:hypothetical protein
MHLPIRVAIFAAVLIAEPSLAAPCFCLQAGGQVWYDCIERKRGPSAPSEFDCIGQTGRNGTERSTVTDGYLLTRVTNGTEPCKPCEIDDSDVGRTMRPLASESSTMDASRDATEARD